MKIESWLHILVFLLLCGCSGGGGEEEVTPPTEPETPKVQIALNCGIASRATETSFESGDKVGLFVVNYNGSSAGTLQNTGNHADNVSLLILRRGPRSGRFTGRTRRRRLISIVIIRMRP